jgi:hypothetical protein
MNAVAVGLRAILWAVCLAAGLLLLSSLLRQPLTLGQTGILLGFTALSLVRPLDALLVFAALGPIVGLATAVVGVSFGGWLLETLVLLLLVPWTAMQVRWIRSARWRTLDWALLVLAAAVAGSALAHLPIIVLRTGSESIAHAIWQFFTREYLLHPPGYGVVSQAVPMLEGLGLCAFVSHLANDPTAVRRVAGMAIGGGTALAMLNVARLFEVALRRGPLTETLGEALRTLRINTQFADLNAAGSYLALMAVAAVGLSDLRTRRGTIYAAAALPLVLAVWLTGSRTALAATGLGVIGLFAVRHRHGAWRLILARRRAIAAAAIVTVVLAAVVLYPSGRNVGVRYSVWARAELAATAFDMLADRPLLGVGVSRFYDLFPQYASPALRQAFFESALVPVVRENAHNNFLQILAELGVVGFAAFVLILLLAVRPGAVPDDTVRPAVVAAICSFLFTALFGHPLLTHAVAYPFWLMLGLAAAGATDIGQREAAIVKAGAGALIVCFVLMLPFRDDYERRHANLDGVALGMSNWQRDQAGTRFRWAASQSALFVESQSRVVRLPMRASGSGACVVEIRVDGQPADRVTVPATFWQELRLRLPAASDRTNFSRVDLFANEGCVEGVADPQRTLMVGRPETMGGASAPALPR